MCSMTVQLQICGIRKTGSLIARTIFQYKCNAYPRRGLIFLPSFKGVLKSLPRRSLFVKLGTALIKYLRRTHQPQRCDLELVNLPPAPDFR